MLGIWKPALFELGYATWGIPGIYVKTYVIVTSSYVVWERD